MAAGQSMETRVSYQQWKEAISAFLETLNIIFSSLASGEEFCNWMIDSQILSSITESY